MQFNKPMIELVYEIRRYSPSELKPAVKLANPELFAELQNHYHDGASTVCKALIKELFSLAGSPWPERLVVEAEEPPKQSVRVYRGQVQVEDRPQIIESEEQKPRAKRVYRGQVVYE